jgi:Fic-DOC domain mobile mystery protein B
VVKFPTITGATPIDDTSGLKLDIHTYDELVIAEAQNIAEAVTKYLAKKPSKRTAPFNVEWSFKLHKEMYSDVWAWAGELRSSQPNVGVPIYNIRTELHNLFEDLKVWQQSKMPLIEQAARLHHRAVFIHPFTNGNGRWSRLLADIWLKQNRSQPIEWPSQMGQESPIRIEYIAAVKLADKGDYSKLMEIYARFSNPSIK